MLLSTPINSIIQTQTTNFGACLWRLHSAQTVYFFPHISQTKRIVLDLVVISKIIFFKQKRNSCKMCLHLSRNNWIFDRTVWYTISPCLAVWAVHQMHQMMLNAPAWMNFDWNCRSNIHYLSCCMFGAHGKLIGTQSIRSACRWPKPKWNLLSPPKKKQEIYACPFSFQIYICLMKWNEMEEKWTRNSSMIPFWPHTFSLNSIYWSHMATEIQRSHFD